MFFGGNPAFNRELYEAVHREMERDYSPTYWFRVMRAQQLLDLYRRDPAAFQSLAETYRYDPDPAQRAPHRLAVWLKRDDLVFQNCEDLRREQGRKLQKVLDDPNRFNFSVRKDLIGANDLRNQEFYLQASPAALGTLVYISYETRKLFEEMNRRGQKWVPIDVTSLVRPLDSTQGFSAKARSEAVWHCTGQVFDINYSRMPEAQREALRFVLDDMGWNGYLGFVEESGQSETMHIGAAPSAREFFTSVFQEAIAAAKG